MLFPAIWATRRRMRTPKLADNQENRKENAGDGGGERRLQASTDQGCLLLHLTLTIAFCLLIDVIQR
jgi:hypothetical protein